MATAEYPDDAEVKAALAQLAAEEEEEEEIVKKARAEAQKELAELNKDDAEPGEAPDDFAAEDDDDDEEGRELRELAKTVRAAQEEKERLDRQIEQWEAQFVVTLPVLARVLGRVLAVWALDRVMGHFNIKLLPY